MTKVAFDTGSLCKVLFERAGMDGIARYTYELSKALLSLNPEGSKHQVQLSSIRYPQYSSKLDRHFKQLGFTNGVQSLTPWKNKACDKLINLGIPFSTGRSFGKLISRKTAITPETRLVHWPLIAEELRGQPGNIVECVTVHDIIPLTQPQLCSPTTVKELSPVLRRAASKADHFFAVSEFTKQQLCEFFNIQPDRVSVVPLAASSNVFYPVENEQILETARKRYLIPDGNYILSLAAMDPRKNLERLIDAFIELLEATKQQDLTLVLAGEERPGMTAVLNNIRSFKKARQRIVFTGYIQEEDLAALYSGALFFANPSLIEGFGLPPLEAMQCGAPVITSSTSSIPEVTGPAAILINPASSTELTDAMYQLLTDSELRKELSSAGLERAREFSWTRCARMTTSVYNDLG